ncbi:MAG: glycoside hydrolase family 3 C-terminal domain-containing protein [Novosphingobium sp.]|nr:glycoside hydrolase family 3 C-terminal domain-containing protein [Novosphingobium sp.]
MKNTLLGTVAGGVLAALLPIQSWASELEQAEPTNAWMAPEIVARQSEAGDDAGREAVAAERARLLISAMSSSQKMQQLTGSRPEILPELPQCFGARHVSGIAELQIPTFRVSNGPVGVGQNDCVSRSLYEAIKDDPNPYASYVAYTHPTSAQATALPSATAVAASFEPTIAAKFGNVIATEMNNLALHVFEAPGINLARLPVLGRAFEYFGEDPYLSGVMAVAETKAVQDLGLIAMPKHFIANEQETNRQTIQETIDEQTLREIYLLPFEMVVKDAKAGAVMCAYNYVNGFSSCENEKMLTGVLRNDWGFTGYVQSDFFAMKTTVATLKSGMDHEMPLPQHWSPDKLSAALAEGALDEGDIDRALVRRYTQAFKAGIFDRPLAQTPIDFARGGKMAREIGANGSVLLQNNGALPFDDSVRSIVLVGKSSQVYAQQAVAGGSMTGQPMGAGGGSSDVVPNYTVSPIEGLGTAGKKTMEVRHLLVDDDNSNATLDGMPTTFEAALGTLATADAIVVMAGTVSEEGADRATFTNAGGGQLAENAAAGTSLDWYVEVPKSIATIDPAQNPAKNSQTLSMIEAILAVPSQTKKSMPQKTALVLKDNAGVTLPASLIGPQGPAILEVWFPGQEDGNIVADVLFGKVNPSGKLPVTIPYAGKSFLDHARAEQFPGVIDPETGKQTVTYSEQLHIGYRWYDANISGECALVEGRNPCVAFPFGHGLSYTTFAVSKPKLSFDRSKLVHNVTAQVANTGEAAGAEVLQVYLSFPEAASAIGAAQPPKRLVGFRKVNLKPGEKHSVTLTIDPNASNHPLDVWNTSEGRWVRPSGRVDVWVGVSSSPDKLRRAGSIVQ